MVKALALFRSRWPSRLSGVVCTIPPRWPVAVPHALVGMTWHGFVSDKNRLWTVVEGKAKTNVGDV